MTLIPDLETVIRMADDVMVIGDVALGVEATGALVCDTRVVRPPLRSHVRKIRNHAWEGVC